MEEEGRKSSAVLLEGNVATQQIRTLKVSDLLGCKPIGLDNAIIKEGLADKVVLVTGGPVTITYFDIIRL